MRGCGFVEQKRAHKKRRRDEPMEIFVRWCVSGGTGRLAAREILIIERGVSEVMCLSAARLHLSVSGGVRAGAGNLAMARC